MINANVVFQWGDSSEIDNQIEIYVKGLENRTHSALDKGRKWGTRQFLRTVWNINMD